MSANYHAFQNKKILFSVHEALAEQWQTEFTNYDPKRVAEICHWEYDEDYLYIKYQDMDYRLVLEKGHLEKRVEDIWSEDVLFNEAMAIYHVMHHVKDVPSHSGKWILSTAFDPVKSTRASMPDPLFTPFALKYGDHVKNLEKSCIRIGGIKSIEGDLSYEFAPFPFLHMKLVFWEADDGIPAQVQILVDSRVTDYIHHETLGCIISDLFDRIEQITE